MVYSKKNQRLILTAVIVVLVLLLLISGVLGRQRFFPEEPTIVDVKMNGRTIKAETVSDPAAEYRGLSGRPSLCAACGMLFLFGDEAPREFVMRQMEFPLDIIFISRQKIVNIAANLPPEGNEPQIIYKSEAPADAVLEVNGGYAAEQGIKIGDYVEY